MSVLSRLGLEGTLSGAYSHGEALPTSGEIVESVNPATGEVLARVQLASTEEYEALVANAQAAFAKWRMVPAPKRGEIIRQAGEALRQHKDDLGALVTMEMGKILSEGLGEVQESIDMADLAVGMSRQLCGATMHSERPGHRMYEQWHPLGVVGIITAFNFPNAVWAWNAMVAAIAGDTMIWKPSLKTPLVAIATHKIIDEVFIANGHPGVMNLIIGADAEVGETMIRDRRLPLISATGSTRMGRHVGTVVAQRLGRSLLELGGNNAIIVEPDADLGIAIPGIVFGACGTSGQRCTSTRRVYVHESVADTVIDKLVSVYKTITIGDPLDEGNLMGPLIDEDAVEMYEKALVTIQEQGGEILVGGSRLERDGFFVKPTIIKAHDGMDIVKHETFAPILYVFTYTELTDAIARQNDVDQGLSSAIFTNNFRSSETFLSHMGSDCGIANVNIGTSGAEIGGAFGGEKDTGGGREAGSDAWKAYMRRQTNTLNWSTDLPLAQGVRFDV